MPLPPSLHSRPAPARLLCCLLALLIAAALGIGSTAAPAQDDPGAMPDARNMSREERLRMHEQRVREIIEKRREEREQEARRRAAEAAGEPQPGPPGEALPPQEPPPQEPAPSVRLGVVILYVEFQDPASGDRELDTIVRVGDRFLSEIMLQNELGTPVERVRLAIRYDKRFLKPLRIFDDALRPYLAEEPRFETDTRDSVLIYDAKLSRPVPLKDVPVLRMMWEARQATEFTPVRFEFAAGETEDHYHTGVYDGETNVLGEHDDPLDGVLSGSLMILPPFNPRTGEERLLQGKKEELRQLYTGSIGGLESRVGLQLSGPAQPPVVGEEFDVDVALHNPQGAVVDSVQFFLLFDTNILEVVDQDKGNWIKRGVNVHDGLFRRQYPFDFHKHNEADNARGIVQYSMSLSRGLSLPSGTFARVRFRAKQPTAETSVSMVPGRPGAPGLTAVKMFGFDLLSFDPNLTTSSVATAILPKPIETARSEAAQSEPDAAQP